MDVFHFPARAAFLNRVDDLARLEDWWDGDERNALLLYGRRRVGKSWLFRSFADGKQALLLVADRRAEAPQLGRFADLLAPVLGVRPALTSIVDLIEALYTAAASERLLVVLDEFPYLLPARTADRDEVLTTIQAVMEERDSSNLKLILCGSYISQMEALARGPLRGRLTELQVMAMPFSDAQGFVATDAGAVERIERYAVSGGMSLYLDELARGGTLRNQICRRVLDPRGPLFNDPREVLEEELRTPGTYYSLLEELATGKKSLGDLAAALGRKTTDLQGYLETLQAMQLVQRTAPVTARADERVRRYSLADNFMRFWFRFVFPFQDDLKTGLQTAALYDAEIGPDLADHTSPTFEALCREWVLRVGLATRVGDWWGNALNEHRKDGTRTSEEIDVVGLVRSRAVVIGECKWTGAKLGSRVLDDLETYKMPAMRQAKVLLAASPQLLLFSRSGFTDDLIARAATRPDLTLVTAEQLVADLLAG